MSKKLYVGNMNYDVDESSLTDIFSEYGEVVSAKVIIDHMSGRSKGFGFVEMASDEEAQAAIDGLNGKEVQGRELKVNEALEKPKRNNFRRERY
jgi:RNA recognition motif-containing protein